MNLNQKITAVNRIFHQLDKEGKKFNAKSGLHCPEGCSKCCTNPEVVSTVLEFLPAAHHLFLAGRDQDLLEKIDEKADEICVFHSPVWLQGHCTIYPYRGLICRLFGSSASVDKSGHKKLAGCKVLKVQSISQNSEILLKKAPVMQEWYMKLYGIDPGLATRYYPVNEAIKKAIEMVSFYYQFRKKPA